MSYKHIPFGVPEKFNVVVEISKGCEVKYEYDEEWDEIKVSGIFEKGFSFPFDYGYVPQTRGGDGDHLDVFVLGSKSIAFGAIVECKPIGIIKLLDRGEQDDKILAVPVSDPIFGSFEKLEELPFDYKTIFADFFKELGVQRKKTMQIQGYEDKVVALKELELAHKNFS